MFYRPQTQQAFTTHSEIRQALWASDNAMFPDSITQEMLDAFGVADVFHVAPPILTATQKLVADGFEQDSNQRWVQKWLVLNKTQEELDADVVTKAAAAEAMWGKIKDERDRRKFAGVLADASWFHSDTFSRTQWLGMLMQGANLAAYDWSTIDNGTRTTTPALAQQVAGAIAAQDSNLFNTARTKKAEMLLLADPNSYDHLTGWPLGYGE